MVSSGGYRSEPDLSEGEIDSYILSIPVLPKRAPTHLSTPVQSKKQRTMTPSAPAPPRFTLITPPPGFSARRSRSMGAGNGYAYSGASRVRDQTSHSQYRSEGHTDPGVMNSYAQTSRPMDDGQARNESPSRVYAYAEPRSAYGQTSHSRCYHSTGHTDPGTTRSYVQTSRQINDGQARNNSSGDGYTYSEPRSAYGRTSHSQHRSEGRTEPGTMRSYIQSSRSLNDGQARNSYRTEASVVQERPRTASRRIGWFGFDSRAWTRGTTTP